MIKPAGGPELAAILAIERDSFPSPWTRELYQAELEQERTVFIAAVAGAGVVGYALAWRVWDEGHVLKMAVLPSLRRRGIGSRLMDALLAEFRQRGVEEVWLEARENNLAALTFYRKAGLVEIGLRRGYYQDTGENAVVMWRKIKP